MNNKQVVAKKTTLKFFIAAALLALFTALALTVSSSRFAFAASEGYFVYGSFNNFEKAAGYKLETAGNGEFRIALQLKKNDRFYISDGIQSFTDATLGNEGGLIRVPADGKYRILLNPNAAYDDAGNHIKLEQFVPDVYLAEINVDGVSAEHALIYNRYRTAYDEYYLNITLATGASVRIKDSSGKVFAGKDGTEAVFTADVSDEYRLSFRPDSTLSRPLTGESVLKLYLYCEANEFSVGESNKSEYLLLRNEEQTSYTEYRIRQNGLSAGKYRYYVSNEYGDPEYTFRPSLDGTAEIKDKGDYWFVYSPDRIYSVSESRIYRTTAVSVTEAYGGFYVMGSFNNFEKNENFKLEENTENKDFEEYCIGLSLSVSDVPADYYITDGETRYRNPLTGQNARIEKAGEYELKFSPTHNYGRGYTFKLTEKQGGAPAAKETVIRTEEEFLDFLSACSDNEYSINATFSLSRDLDFGGTEVKGARIFNGIFDGCFHSLKGLKIISDNDYAGLFETVSSGAEIKRLSADIDIIAEKATYSGLIAKNEGKLFGITVSGSLKADGYAGGITGYNEKTGLLENCVNTSQVRGIVSAGGVAGYSSGEIKNCENRGEINVSAFSSAEDARMLNVGGIAGHSAGKLVGCVNRGAVGYGPVGRHIGGISGLGGGEIKGCVNYAAVKGESGAGGISGYYGRLTAEDQNGIRDYLSGSDYLAELYDRYFGSSSGGDDTAQEQGVHIIEYCINYGPVSAYTIAGGIAGHAGAAALSLRNCISVSGVTAKSDYSGGIAGRLTEGTVTSCASGGTIISEKGSYSGGIAGLSEGEITSSLSCAQIDVSADYAGGIVGSGAVVKQCYTNVLIKPGAGRNNGYIAGAVSDLDSTAYNYYIGKDLGGIAGINYRDKAKRVIHEELKGTGTLNPALIGFDSELWLSGADSERYPVPRTFEEYNAQESVPDGFAKEGTGLCMPAVIVIFEDEDGKTIASFRFAAGESLSQDNIPAPPEKAEYFAAWDRTEFIGITENIVVRPVYDKTVYTLSSGGKTPLILAEGVFPGKAELVTSIVGKNYTLFVEKDGVPYVYEKLTVKYRVGKGGDYTVSIIEGANIEKAKAVRFGEYLCFELAAGQSFTVEKAKENLTPVVIAVSVGCAAAGALVVGVVWISVRLTKRKSKKDSGEA